MDLGGSGSGSIVKKQEEDDKGEKRDVKPIVKTLNRVPRMSSSYRPKEPTLKIKLSLIGACVSREWNLTYNPLNPPDRMLAESKR